MYISLYRKYRPQTFSDMVGQSAAVSVLQESLRESKLGHAYLFSGQRGCGKTSAARLVAKTLNCSNLTKEHEPCGKCSNCKSITLGEHLDVIEIDGASNRGINEIRDLKTHVNLKPLSASNKVYIIDEVHMLTEAAFNALLKTLEEPPRNVFFLLATTEPYKVPVTIRSRCQHIPFRRISILDMVERISYVCDCEKVFYEKEAVWEIARQADGALRDALSLSEQAIALGKGKLSVESVNDLTGGSSRTELEKWISTLRVDPGSANVILNKMLSAGMSSESFCESLFAIFRDLWVYCLWGDRVLEALEISETGQKFLKEESTKWTPEKLKAVCFFCNSLLPRTRYGLRMEVFSGLIMLKLTEIFSGTQTVQTEKHVIPIRAAQTNIPLQKPTAKTEKLSPQVIVKNKSFDQTLNTIKKDTVTTAFSNSDTDKFIESNTDITKICQDLGDNEFSSLISKLSTKKLLIAAALIDGSIMSNDENWELTYPNECLSKSIMSVPNNKSILSKAIFEVWGKKAPEQQHSEASATRIGKTVKQKISTTAEVTNSSDTKTGTAVANSPNRILKLLGAEVLYVQEAYEEDEINLLDCNGERNE